MSQKPWTNKDSLDFAAWMLFLTTLFILAIYFTRLYEVLLDGSLSIQDIAFIIDHSYAKNCYQDFDYSRGLDPNISDIELEALSSLYSIERNKCARQIFTLWGIEVSIEISLIIFSLLTILHQGGRYHNKVGQKILGFIRSLSKLYSQVTLLLKPKKIRLRISKQCAYCRSRIHKKATVCKHCHRDQP